MCPFKVHILLNCFVLADNTRLKGTDYGCLCEKLHSCAAKWKQIAQSLRFTCSEILNIETCPRNMELNSYIDNVVGVWLEWAPGDARGSEDYATLEQLQNAVSKAGFGVVASELKGM
jgi:aminoglycoside phosphotransferase